MHLYDVRNYAGGAFAEMKCPQHTIEQAIQRHAGVSQQRAQELSKSEWKSISFNTKGSEMLATTDKGLALVIDGFQGAIQQVYCAEGDPTLQVGACFTPAGDTVLIGNGNGSINCMSTKTGALVKKLEGHKQQVGCIKANPKFAQLASACTNTALWLW